MNLKSLLKVNSLSVSYRIKGAYIPVVDQVSFTINQGEILAIVGESGCGKSQLALALAGLSPKSARIDSDIDGDTMTVAMIFQEPLSALNPLMTVGKQIREGLAKKHLPANEQVIKLLSAVGIPEPEVRCKQYPHEFSGGMRQRALIAMALAREPDLLIADEPTTALDVTIQAQIIALLKKLNQERKLSILFITHDLSLLESFAHRVAVMYAGRIVEIATIQEIFNHPKHPYTSALINLARLQKDENGLFPSIPGSVPPPHEYPQGCRFHPRCPRRTDACAVEIPVLSGGNDHVWACPVVK